MGTLIYYRRNVNFDIGVRANILDRKGQVLTIMNPYYAVKADELRDFLWANKESIEKGYIMKTDEPSVEWDTSNAISDEKASELVKTYMGLKNELPKLTSIPTIEKILAVAEAQDRPAKTIKLIESRLAEIKDDEISIGDMRGVV